MRNNNPQLTSNLYDLIKVGNEINELFGGRSVHLISLVPGGVIYSPSRENITLARRYFQKALSEMISLFCKIFKIF